MDTALMLLAAFVIILYVGKTTITFGRRAPEPDFSDEGIKRMKSNIEEMFADYRTAGGRDDDDVEKFGEWLEQSPKWGPRMRAGRKALGVVESRA